MKKMKRNINLSCLSLVLAFMVFGCEQYLDIPPEAAITEEQIFGTYQNFQGFQDQLLRNLVDYNRHGVRVTHAIAGEALSPSGQSVFNGNIGNYVYLLNNRGIFAVAEGNAFQVGLYSAMWENIRMANMCLKQLESGLLTNATDDQRKWLKGQALFFRGYYYYEFVRSFGTVPYIDKVISSENQNLKRHWTYTKNGKTYTDSQACFERIAEDFQEASQLLPSVWPNATINYGRPTSVAALGFKAKALQFSASPLFNEQATGKLEYNKELLDRCAQACIETINLAKSIIGSQPAGMSQVNTDGLSNWQDFRQAFATFNGDQPYTGEVLFHRPVNYFGNPIVSQSNARGYGENQLTGQKAAQGSQMYMDKFEMADGSRYKIAYDNNPLKRWENRDKRLRFTYYVHNDLVDKIKLNFSTSQLDTDGALNSNAIRKFLADGVTKNNPGKATYSTPLLRLADIYLTYAEAVYESTGSFTASAPGSSLTAEGAVNIVRLRAGQPVVAVALPFYQNNPLPGSEEQGSDPAFRLLYRNERNVELAYEGVYWFDIRRWKVAHLKDGVQIQALNFNVDASKNVIESSVTRVDKQVFTFKPQHYWMPFENSLTRFSTDWEQNPGW